MKYLPACGMNEEKLELLLGLTSIRSEPIITSIKWHLVHGWEIKLAAGRGPCDPKNLERALKTLNDAATKVERIKEIDLFVLTRKTDAKTVSKVTEANNAD